MLVKSTLYSDMSGLLANAVAARGNSGIALRSHRTPVNPNTPRQQAVRGNLSQCVAAWAELSNEEREAWAAYAAGNPGTNRIGEACRLSGLDWYVKANSIRLLIGQPAVAAAPAINAPCPLADPSTLSIAADYKSITLTWMTPGEWYDDGGGIYIRVGITPPTVNYFRGPYIGCTAVLGDSTKSSCAVIVNGLPGSATSRYWWTAVATHPDGRPSSMISGMTYES